MCVCVFSRSSIQIAILWLYSELLFPLPLCSPHTSHVSLIINIVSSPSKRDAEIPNPEICVSDFFLLRKKVGLDGP